MNVQDIFELTMVQKGMLFHYLRETNENLYNVQLSFDICGRIDPEILNEAFGYVQSENEVLRSVFSWEKVSKPLQIILRKSPVDLCYHDLTHLPVAAIKEMVDSYSQKDQQERFDLTALPVRMRLIQTGENTYLFNITHHHILYDGWSCGILLKELFDCYVQLVNNQISQLPSKPGYKEMYLALKKNNRGVDGETFWKSYLADYEIVSLIPANKTGGGDDAVQKIAFSMGNQGTEAYSSKHKVTQAAVLYTAFGILLSKYNNLDDVIIGTTVSHRNIGVRGADKVIGNFINTLPLRIKSFENASLSQLVEQVNSDLITRQEYYDTSYYEIKQFMNISHEHGLFDAIMVIENYPIDKALFNISDDFSISVRGDYENSSLPMVVKVFLEKELRIELVYKTKNISHSMAASVGRHLIKILNEIITNGEKKIRALELLTEEESKELLYSFNDTASQMWQNETVLSLFEKQAALYPDKVAVHVAGKEINYARLNEVAGKIAAYLLQIYHVQPGMPVALLLDREAYLIPCMLGILKAGAAYLPIDPAYPPERINSILADSLTQVLITRTKHLHPSFRVPEGCMNLDEILNEVTGMTPVITAKEKSGNSLAYIIYTSGSTGKPKGVMIAHASLMNYITWAASVYTGQEPATFPLYSSIAFDLTVTSVFLPLVTGNTIDVYENDDKSVLIEKVVRDNKADIIKLTPSHLKILKEGFAVLPSLPVVKKLIVGGENLPASLAKDIYELFSGNVEIYNEYGPTEATVGCMIYKYNPADIFSSVPIGKPINNTQIYILDKYLKPSPPGVSGELYISGMGLATGYYQNNTLTAERFIDNPFVNGSKMYKTGDLASYQPGGNIIYEGRTDSQVKIRGYRIELAEIEARIRAYVEEPVEKTTAQDKMVQFGDKDTMRCKNCVLTSRYPGITFNEQGICNVCEDYFKRKDFVNSYFRNEQELQLYFDNRKAVNDQPYDCLLLFSGGKDSTYTLYKLMEMGLRVLTFTFDNGFISKAAFQNIVNTTRKFNIQSIIRTSAEINKVLLESLKSKHNACTGCWNSINTLGVEVAREYGIDTIVSGLSRGQIIEMRLEGLLEAGVTDEGAINDNLQLFRKSFHSKDNIFYALLKADIDVEFLSKINFIDYFRYDRVNTEGVKEYLKRKEWIQPKDTGLCSTNCVVNDVGIYMHWKKKGYHFYEAPLGWDTRLQVIEREKTIHELNDSFNEKKIDTILTKIGYYDPVRVEDAVVAVKEDKDGNSAIVAYYMANGTIENEQLRKFIGTHLPSYMVPAYFIRLQEFPLTANGKIDLKKLPDPGAQAAGTYVVPVSKKEKILTEIWSKVLGVERVGITDNFFGLGGDSIKSIQVSSRMRSVGYELAVKDILELQTIEKACTAIKDLVALPNQSAVTGKTPLSPIQRWFFEQATTGQHHFNQSAWLHFTQRLSLTDCRKIFEKIKEHHDALRMVFKKGISGYTSWNNGTEQDILIEEHHCTGAGVTSALLEIGNRVQSSIDLENGPLMRLCLFQRQEGTQLLIVIHHLVVDTVSWSILFEDIETLYQQLTGSQPLILPFKTDSFQRWSASLADYTKTKAFENGKTYWREQLAIHGQSLPVDYENEAHYFRDQCRTAFGLNKAYTEKLLTQANRSFNTSSSDILLTAFLLGVHQYFNNTNILVDLEGHGREDSKQGMNVSRTVGWFTSIYPVLLQKSSAELPDIIKQVKDTVRRIPNKGIDYLIARYMEEDNQLPASLFQRQAQVSFNYLGQLDAGATALSYSILPVPAATDTSGNIRQLYNWNIIAAVTNGELEVQLLYSKKQYKEETIANFLDVFNSKLVSVIDYCCGYDKTELSPSDLQYKEISIARLNELQHQYDIEDIYTLSPMQEGMLFHSLLDAASKSYLEQKVFSLEGNINLAALEKSINALMGRYDALRTIFLHEGYERPVQLVVKEKKADFQYKDIREECAGDGKEPVLQRYKQGDLSRNFELRKDALIRVTVLRTGETEYEMIWSHHHIIMDGWCSDILWNDFSSYYLHYAVNRQIAFQPAKKFSRFIHWFENADKSESVAYWKNYLLAYNLPARIPGKNATPAASFIRESECVVLNEVQLLALQSLSRHLSVTVNTVLQLAWGILLAKYNNTQDVVYGTVMSGRPSEIDGIERMIGLFINTVPVRVTFNEKDRVGDMLQKLQTGSVNCEQHQYLALPAIQAVSETGRDLFDHILVFENESVLAKTAVARVGDQYDAGFVVHNIDIFAQTTYEATVVIIPGEAIKIRLDYNANSFTSHQVKRILLHFLFIIEQVTAHNNMAVGDITLLTGDEKQQLLLEFDYTDVKYPADKNIVGLFDEQVRRTPGNIAVKYGQEALTYTELDERSGRLAYLLRQKGVQHKEIVGLLTERSIETVVGILGILKAGAAYLPIGADYPAERIAWLAADSGIKNMVTTRTIEKKVANHIATIFMEELQDIPVMSASYSCPHISPADLCYIIYTSGTTGEPKGVMVEHGNVVRLFFNDAFQFQFDERDVWTLFHNHYFDFSVWEMFGALLFGGKLIVIPSMVAKDAWGVLKILEEEKVTVLNQTPSAFYNLMQVAAKEKETPLHLRYVIFGGEALAPGRLKEWRQQHPQTRLINMFGITETTVHVTYKEIGDKEIDGNISNIGRPIPTLSVYILDNNKQPVPKEVIGELYVGGAGVAKGYLGREALTKSRFITHPFQPQQRLYRSGDLAKILESGEIAYIGRIDNQVQLRGFRIELGEIEHKLCGYDGIKEAIVVARGEEEDKHLVAYYLANDKKEPGDVRSYLLSRLPEYMVPSFYVHLESVPLTTNGKLDKKSLPAPEIQVSGESAKPQNQVQKELIAIWAQLLGIEEEKIGVHTNFFDIGGNSLKIVKMVDKIRQQFGVEITVAQAFTYPVIFMLAAFLNKKEKAATGAGTPEQDAGADVLATLELVNQVQH